MFAQVIRQRVVSVLQELGLSHLSSACVGSESAAGARGISGGERRRVSIGMELVTEPALIIMDGEQFSSVPSRWVLALP